jgi:hypothetical protein
MRMKHLVALTEHDREARWAKYREADPDRAWEPDYGYTIESPGELQPWPVRSPDLPFLVTWGAADASAAALDLAGPALSVVVVVEAGEERAAVDRLVELVIDDADVEMFVVTRDPYAAEVVEQSAPGTAALVTDASLSAGGLRNAALGRARGDYLTFTAVNDTLTADDIGAILDAHEQGHAVVGVPLGVPATSAASGVDWPSSSAAVGEDGDGAVAYVSFAREPLLTIGGFDAEMTHGFDTIAARTITRLGLTATVIDVAPRGIVDEGGVIGRLRRQYELGRGLARADAVVGNGPDEGRGLARRHQRPGVPSQAGLVALGGVAARLGAARERRRNHGDTSRTD